MRQAVIGGFHYATIARSVRETIWSRRLRRASVIIIIVESPSTLSLNPIEDAGKIGFLCVPLCDMLLCCVYSIHNDKCTCVKADIVSYQSVPLPESQLSAARNHL
jgi:hypothetical protein